MLNTHFSPWPSFTEAEAEAVKQVVLSNKVNYWTGTEGRDFEKEFAVWSDSEYAVALANGTLALDVALKAVGVGSTDDIIVTPRTFLASVSSVVMAGANPIFAEVDLNSQNITSETIEAVLTPNTKAVIVVHLGGMPAEMDAIMALSKKHGFYVIEDCAQAHGARYKGRSVGSIGHIGAWSFCQDKIMSTGGEGGMVTTNDKALWSSMWAYKDHGKSYETVYQKEHPPGFRWLHESFGSNLRMTEMQAAIGRIQLKRMNSWHQARQANAENILEVCREFQTSLRVPNISDCIEHAWYKCYVFVHQGGLRVGWNRDRIMNEINSLGIPCYQGSCSEVYLEKAFENTGYRPKNRLPVAKELGETSLMFLVHPALTEKEIEITCTGIRRVMTDATAIPH
jgi:dTDP-4-amino-4,6-dideoxygalactose transaminase